MVKLTRHVSIAYRFFVFMIYFFPLEIPDSSSTELVENVCRSAGCIDIAEKITKYMDPTILPCDDFYKFVCNKFHGNRILVEEHFLVTLITSQLMKSSSLEKNKPFQKAFKLYELCMAEHMTGSNTARFLNQLIEKIGGWPIVEGDKWREKNWENVSASLSQSEYYWGIFFKNTLNVGIFSTSIELRLDYLEAIQYPEQLATVAISLGADSSKNISQMIRDISDHFENFKKSDAVDIKQFSIGEMMVKWPSIDWMTYFTGYFANLPNVTIYTNQTVWVNTHHVNDVVDFIATTSKEKIMNYVVLRIIEDTLPYSSEIVMYYYFGMQPQTQYSLSAHQKYCTVVTIYSLPEMVFGILRVNHIDDQIQHKFQNLSELVRNKMGELINQAHLDNETLRIQREILSNISFKIWNTDENIEELIGQYKDLVLNEGDFLDSLWSVTKFHRNSQNERIVSGYYSMKLRPSHWKSFMNEFRELLPYLSPESQTINVPVGFALIGLFEDEFPKYLSYGRVGAALGHEIGHAFSMNEINAYERNATDLNEFEKNVLSNKLNCFKQLYNTYTEQLNATIVRAHSEIEDVADHIGFKLAHLIYKDYLELNGAEPQLPNLNYTSMQMFWISLAHTACVDVPELAVVRYGNNHHSPHRFRINMPLSNNPAFSEAFHCPPGSRMNPVNKCTFW